MDRKLTFDDYRGIIRALRDPEKGCPWDKAQTHESLKPCMIHEMTEAVAAVNLLSETGDPDNLCEELGDVLLQVVLQSQIAEEEGLFSLDDVIRKAGEKMLRRHPHVFSSEASPEKEEVPGRWEAIKQAEKQGRSAEYERKKKEAEASCRPRSGPSSECGKPVKTGVLLLTKGPKQFISKRRTLPGRKGRVMITTKSSCREQISYEEKSRGGIFP